MKKTACLLLLSLLSTPLLADYPVEVLQLNGHTADEVIPLIKPFIDKDGSVGGIDDRLVVRTSPEKMEQIKQIVRDIDSPPRRLMFYVHQGSGNPPNSRAGNGAEAGADSGRIVGLPSDRGEVQPGKIVGLPPAGVAPGSSGLQAGTHGNRTQTQRIQAMEGKPAYIDTGTQVPIYDGAVGVGPLGAVGAVNTRYKNATTGFYALARTSGNQVTVQISSQQIQPGTTNEQFDTQRASTTISGRIGEWMPLGGSSRGGFSDRQRGGLGAATSNNQDRSIYLKVEALD